MQKVKGSEELTAAGRAERAQVGKVISAAKGWSRQLCNRLHRLGSTDQLLLMALMTALLQQLLRRLLLLLLMTHRLQGANQLLLMALLRQLLILLMTHWRLVVTHQPLCLLMTHRPLQLLAEGIGAAAALAGLMAAA